VPGRARPGKPARAAARKRSGDRDAGETAVSGWLGDEEAALGWAPPDEMVVPDGTDMVGAGLWPADEDAVRDFAAPGDSRGPHRRAGAAPGGTAEKEWFGGEEAARAACLKLLTSAPRTRAQLAAALRRRRVPDEIAESVLTRFAEVGLIDDAAFAKAWVESRHHSRGLARKALAAELRQRGIPDGEVRAAVDSLGPQDEAAAARRLVLKRMAATRGRPLPTRARQLLGMLARKGYSAGLAAQVVREALEREEADDPDARLNLALICEESAGSDWS
jgi:regulatory protein